VGAAGAKITLLGFIILPIIWCIPEALITAEYATAFPEATGGTAWVGAAFGPFWGWMSAWFAFVSGVINTSAYPVLMVSYLELVWGELEPSKSWQRV
jgi:amino acid transporter